MSGGRISQRTVEAVKARADIVELFEARMGPGRRGSGQVMFRCPFHDENTASCRVHPTEKTFHCFGCGEGGDVIHYVRQLENLSFTESVEWLADRYGVEVEREDLSPQERERYDRTKKADGLLEDVAIFYQRYLETADEAEAGRAYLVDRGITHASVQQFRLGFAPSDWERTTRAARERGYADQLLIDAGVAREGQRGLYDWFRGRVIFPLCDARGRVRGFGARVLPGGEGAKYINSPESEIFKKGRILYGLDQARVPIARAKRAIVVEGYTDVIQLHAAGFPETVAAMGTSLTDDQVRELRRLTDRVVLCFDADAAGQEAALRGMGIAERSGLRVQIATLPAGQDPADLIASGPEAFEAVLADTRSVLAFRISRLLARIAEDGADAVYGMVRQVLSTASPGPERDEQVRHVASVLRLSPDSAARLVPRFSRVAPVDQMRRPARRDRRRETEIAFLACCLALPDRGREAVAAGAHEFLRDGAVVAAVPWLRARLDGEAADAPIGAEHVVAEVNAQREEFDVTSEDGRRETEIGLGKLRMGLQLGDIEDRIARLKEMLGTDDHSAEDLAELSRLQRERANLRDRIQRAGD